MERALNDFVPHTLDRVIYPPQPVEKIVSSPIISRVVGKHGVFHRPTEQEALRRIQEHERALQFRRRSGLTFGDLDWQVFLMDRHLKEELRGPAIIPKEIARRIPGTTPLQVEAVLAGIDDTVQTREILHLPPLPPTPATHMQRHRQLVRQYERQLRFAA